MDAFMVLNNMKYSELKASVVLCVKSAFVQQWSFQTVDDDNAKYMNEYYNKLTINGIKQKC